MRKKLYEDFFFYQKLLSDLGQVIYPAFIIKVMNKLDKSATAAIYLYEYEINSEKLQESEM